MSTINNNFNNAVQNFDQATSLAKDALSLATAINGGNLKDTLDSASKLFQNLGNLNDIIGGSTNNTNAAQGAAMSSKLSALDMMKLFGMDAASQDKEKAEEALASLAGGKITSLSQLLAVVGSLLANTQQKLADKVSDIATKLDQQQNDPNGKGVSFKLNQDLQRALSDSQMIQQTLNTVNSTVTNLSKSGNDAQKETAGNLRV